MVAPDRGGDFAHHWNIDWETDGLEEILEGVIDRPVKAPRHPVKTRDPAKQFERALYEADIIRLRASGMTYDRIAEKLGCSRNTVANAIKRAVKSQMKRAGVEEARSLELMRLDTALVGIWPLIDVMSRAQADEDGNITIPAPNYDAIDAFMKINKARREMLGLDAAKKYEVQGDMSVGATEAAVELGNKLERFSELADKMAAKGIGSGRVEVDITDEARAVGVRSTKALVPAVVEQPDIVIEDAEIVEPMPAPEWTDSPDA